MNNHYTTIIHAVRKVLDITLTEYCVADLIRKLVSNPKAPVPGWYSGRREDLADALGLSRQGLYKMLNRLIAVGVIEESPNGMLKHTQKWYQLTEVETKDVIEADDKIAKQRDIEKRFEGRKRKQSLHRATENDVNEVDTEGKQSLRNDVNEVDTEGKQSLRSKGLMIDSDSYLGKASESENEFSPTTADLQVEIYEPMKRETLTVEVLEKGKTSNGAQRDVLGDEFADVMATQFGAKIVTVKTAEPIPDTLGKPRKAKRQIGKPEPFEETRQAFCHFSNPDKIAVLWSRWLEYKKEQHGERYKTEDSEKTQLRALWKMANGNADQAEKIIEQSIGNLWKGLFQLKTENENGRPKPVNKVLAQQDELARGLVEYYANKRFATVE